MVIIGQSVLNRDDSLQIYSLLETFTDKFNLIQDEWNGFNILQLTAARAGGLEVGAFQRSQSLDDILDSSTDRDRIIISIGADEVNYDKLGNSKIIYIGTHGDRGANAAQLILPSAAYTEKDSIYINTEGRVQFANKASFPPGDAKEDWKIINQLSELMLSLIHI